MVLETDIEECFISAELGSQENIEFLVYRKIACVQKLSHLERECTLVTHTGG